MTPEPIEEPTNKITEIRRQIPNALIVERTPANPVTITETHDIDAIKAKIAKYQNVIAMWQAKIDPLQEIVVEYSALVAEAAPEPEPMEEGI